MDEILRQKHEIANDHSQNTYVFDLDGTIAREHHLDYVRKLPNRELIAIMKELSARGKRIVIHTSRMDFDVDLTLDWLRFYQVPFDNIVFNKPIGCVYVDDRAMLPDDFLRRF